MLLLVFAVLPGLPSPGVDSQLSNSALLETTSTPPVLFAGETAINMPQAKVNALTGTRTEYPVDIVLNWMDISSPTIKAQLEEIHDDEAVDMSVIARYKNFGEDGLK